MLDCYCSVFARTRRHNTMPSVRQTNYIGMQWAMHSRRFVRLIPRGLGSFPESEKVMDKGSSLGQVATRRFQGDEPIGDSGKKVVDYWRWSSDLFEDVQRGIFAEYVVAVALGIAHQMRVGWTGMIYSTAIATLKSSQVRIFRV